VFVTTKTDPHLLGLDDPAHPAAIAADGGHYRLTVLLPLGLLCACGCFILRRVVAAVYRKRRRSKTFRRLTVTKVY